MNKDIVMKLSETMKDSGISSGVIVCKTGFTKNTVTYAKHKGIKLVQLREAAEKDRDFKRTFEIGVLDIPMNIMVSRANITSIDFRGEVINDEKVIMSMYQAKLYDSHGNALAFIKFITHFFDELESRNELLKTTTVIK